MPTPLTGWTKLVRYHADGAYLIALDTTEDGMVDLTTEAALYLKTLPCANGGRDEFSPLLDLNTAIETDTGGAWCQATALGPVESQDEIHTFRVSQQAWRILEGIPRGTAAPQELL